VCNPVILYRQPFCDISGPDGGMRSTECLSNYQCDALRVSCASDFDAESTLERTVGSKECRMSEGA